MFICVVWKGLMTMKIALVSTVFLRTPPEKYGGTERVVANLADGLVDAGHDVTLFATGNSITKAKLIIFMMCLSGHGKGREACQVCFCQSRRF